MTAQPCALCGKPGLLLRHGLCPPCLEAGYVAMRGEVATALRIAKAEPDRGAFMSRINQSYIDHLSKLLEQFPE